MHIVSVENTAFKRILQVILLKHDLLSFESP